MSELVVWQKLIKGVRHIPRTLCTAKESADENSLQHGCELVGLVISKTWVAFTQRPWCREIPGFKIFEFDFMNGERATCNLMSNASFAMVHRGETYHELFHRF